MNYHLLAEDDNDIINIEVNVGLNTTNVDESIQKTLKNFDDMIDSIHGSIYIIQIAFCLLILLIFILIIKNLYKCCTLSKSKNRNVNQLENDIELARI